MSWFTFEKIMDFVLMVCHAALMGLVFMIVDATEINMAFIIGSALAVVHWRIDSLEQKVKENSNPLK